MMAAVKTKRPPYYRFYVHIPSERLVPIIGNYCLDVHLKGWQASRFSLPNRYTATTKYAVIAQSVERILGK